MANPVQSVDEARRRQARRIWKVLLVALPVAALFGVVAAKLVGGGLSALAPISPANEPGGIVLFSIFLAVPLLLRYPRGALVFLLACTTLIDQFTDDIGPTTPGGKVVKVTGDIAFFHSLTVGSFVTPAEMVLFVLLIVWLMKGARERCWHIPTSPLAKSMLVLYLLSLVVGVGFGVVHHGQFKEMLWELRPWYALAAMYLLTSSLFAGRDMFRPLLWTLVLGSGTKSLEGVYYYITAARTMTPRPDSLLGHEESFFFGLFLLSTAALWLFQVRGRLRTAATAIAPLVFVADLGNSRRDAFLLLYVGGVALIVIAYVAMAERRPVLRKLNVVLLIGALVYLGVFWNDGGSLGQPARAIHSAVAPDARDESSNLYREVENYDIEANIHATRSIGQGFGVPVNYVFPITNLTTVDPMLEYIPHDTLLYVWYRLGLIGEITLWTVVGFGIIAGCRLAKRGDRQTAVVGAVAVCAILCWVLMGYNDLGFNWIRIAFFMGFLLGALEVTSQNLARHGRAVASSDVTSVAGV